MSLKRYYGNRQERNSKLLKSNKGLVRQQLQYGSGLGDILSSVWNATKGPLLNLGKTIVSNEQVQAQAKQLAQAGLDSVLAGIKSKAEKKQQSGGRADAKSNSQARNKIKALLGKGIVEL